MSLTPYRVHLLRTSGLPDLHYARIWRRHPQTIRNARIGVTWREHSTPPDTAPRVRQGNWGDLRHPESGAKP